MSFRIAFLNLEQDHKRWDHRKTLIADQLYELKPDIFALNEVCIPGSTARWLQRQAADAFGCRYALVQQSKTNSSSPMEGEALLTRFPIVETGNLDYQARDAVALVTRVEVEDKLIDVFVTHLYKSRGDDSLRLYQVQQLLEWIESRDGAAARIVCGDFNSTLDSPSAKLMTEAFRPSQTAPTAFTPLADEAGNISHPYWERFDRCIDFIWVSEPLQVVNSMVCFNQPSSEDPTLWPSDHAGVWADLKFS